MHLITSAYFLCSVRVKRIYVYAIFSCKLLNTMIISQFVLLLNYARFLCMFNMNAIYTYACASYFIHSISHVSVILLVKVLLNSNAIINKTPIAHSTQHRCICKAQLCHVKSTIWICSRHFALTTQRKTRSTDIFFAAHKTNSYRFLRMYATHNQSSTENCISIKWNWSPHMLINRHYFVYSVATVWLASVLYTATIIIIRIETLFPKKTPYDQ